MIFAVVFAQVLDWATYGPALARNPHGELWLAALTTTDRMFAAKVIAMIVVAAGLWSVQRRYPGWAWYRRGLLVMGWIGVLGAATNVWGML